MVTRAPHSLRWLRQISQQVSQNCLDLFFPPVCVGCHRAGHHLCPACAQQVEPVGSAICARCGKLQHEPIPVCLDCQLRLDTPLVFARIAARHTPPLRQGIHSLKYDKRPELAPHLARYLVAAFGETPWLAVYDSLDGVVPVPLHRDRRRERGYNQSELLAAAFCRAVALPLQADWLERTRATRSQVGLNAEQRQVNVAEAFQAKAAVANKTILLIDDVYTTGATLRACAAAALAAGAKMVYGLILAAPVMPVGQPVGAQLG